VAESIICKRAQEFSRRIFKVCNTLEQRGAAGRRITSELLRCGPSIGANAVEAQEGQTKPDFIAKLSVSRKESRETVYWLELALTSGIVTQDEIAWELREARELRAMIVAAIKTAQANPARGARSRRPRNPEP
jgi:four helix bundle protein